MLTRSLTLALALSAGLAAAQDAPAYFQDQHLVVYLKVEEPLTARNFGNTEDVELLGTGYYRFVASERSQKVLTAQTLADETGTFGRYPSALEGELRELFGTGGVVRAAKARLKLTAADLSRDNVIDSGSLEIGFHASIDSLTSTYFTLRGDVDRSGTFVPGAMTPALNGHKGRARVFHTSLRIEDHLPQRRPEAFFPGELRVSAGSPALGTIAAGDYGFDLTRGAQSPLGIQGYASRARFPHVEESDYYGDYTSEPRAAELLVEEGGDLAVSFGWRLEGRYHGWSLTYRASLTPAQYQALRADGRLVVQGQASFDYVDEDGGTTETAPCSITLELPFGGAGLAGALGD